MNIEPLYSILRSSKDKKNRLLYFLPEKDKKKIESFDYEEKNFSINDSMIGIKKSTLEIDVKGKIIFIENHIFGIKVTSVKTIRSNSNDYYCFIKNNKTINTKRDFMKELLKQI